MTKQVRVAVIGGGVVGVSVLYHLAKLGWSDCCLLERTQLTAGSTWHAAGLLPFYYPNQTMSLINRHSMDLYARLEKETGQPSGFHQCGQLRLATSNDRLDEYRAYLSFARAFRIECDLITREEAQKLWPLASLDGVIAALYHPADGHIAPADLTQAMAISARSMGAKIHLETEVTAMAQTPSGEWRITTTKGDFLAEHVVTATGNYAHQTGAMVGLNVPSIPVMHQYVVTESIREFEDYNKAGLPEMPVLRDDKTRFYLRQENDGLILGPYEPNPQSWAINGVPEGFGAELMTPDYDILEPFIEGTIGRVASFGKAGIKTVVNGPIAHTPDAYPLVGPAPGLRNYWLAEGMVAGICYGGGVGRYLAEWITEGAPTIDMWSVDPRRFNTHAGKIHTHIKNEETYGHIFDIHYPNLEMPAARPGKTSPCYDRLTAAGAVWGVAGGWERARWFDVDGFNAPETLTFRRSNSFEVIGEECRAIREGLGLIDFTSFAKWEVTGPGALAFLNRALANTMPTRDGRVTLAHALDENGRFRAEYTVARLAGNRFYLCGPAFSEMHDEDVLRSRLRPEDDATITNISMGWGCFTVVGPKSRELLTRIVDGPMDNDSFKWFDVQEREVGWAPGVRVIRVNYCGELGWELHHPIAYQHHILDQLERFGADLGLRHVGFRALDSLRMEKSYRAVTQELTSQNTLSEVGLGRFIGKGKTGFIGAEAVAANAGNETVRLVTLEVNCEEGKVEPAMNQAVRTGEDVIALTTSGAYGHYLGKHLAMAIIPADYAAEGTKLTVEILGTRYEAVVIPDSPHDPENLRPRA
ncbi:GcvT family protein [Roseovarius aestuarii]|uniref:4-methylaminobutanoate oxidase (Formaldehyde-forming) n=1 Tax=Roseovarius aestuarii TaxID=475083 RepID=A0A1X7BUQ6_9RHOB|nr:FAD-dependent oxidoreductase [Roseovarius aestuarii]SMC13367.1 4-methylaminobutanoate oxidase (formaldehyde-forming) [Roseovarius aestuarii]